MSNEARLSISLSECGLVADVDAVERHGVGFGQLQQSGVALEANMEEDWRESEKKGLRVAM